MAMPFFESIFRGTKQFSNLSSSSQFSWHLRRTIRTVLDLDNIETGSDIMLNAALRLRSHLLQRRSPQPAKLRHEDALHRGLDRCNVALQRR